MVNGQQDKDPGSSDLDNNQFGLQIPAHGERSKDQPTLAAHRPPGERPCFTCGLRVS